MLIITRRVDETIEIKPMRGYEHLTLGELFAEGNLQISVLSISGSRVRLAVDAPPELKIWRRDHRLTRCAEWASRKQSADIEQAAEIEETEEAQEA